MLSKSATLSAQPGEKWLYADVGFNLLGKVIETVSGQSYEVFMQKHIFEPLQMSSTGYYHQEKDFAKGYSSSQNDVALQNSDYFAAGALYSTVEDLYRYDQALAAGTLLPVPALSAMFTAYMPIPAGLVIHGEQGWGYGYGWFIGPDKPRRIYYDGGQPAGFRAAIWRYPDDQATIIQLCNHEGVMIVPTALAIAEKLFQTGKK
jgi:CubicO group peptidase (beta-lactamase class C family)